MAIYRTKVSAITVKIQPSEGVDAGPIPAVDALKIIGRAFIAISPAESGDRRDVQTSRMGGDARAFPGGRRISTEITMELFGKGTAYVALPASSAEFQHDVLLRGSGCVRAYSAGVVSYKDADTGLETFSMTVYGADGNIFRCVDCVAKPKFSFLPNKPATATYAIEGRLISTPTEVPIGGTLALPTVVPGLWADTVFEIGAWSTATAGAGALVPRKLEIDLGNVTGERPWAGAGGHKGYAIVDRQVRASVDVEPVSLAVFDPFVKAMMDGSASQLGEISTSIPGAAGFAIAIRTGRWASEHPADADFGGLAGWSLQGGVVPGSGTGIAAGAAFGLSVT